MTIYCYYRRVNKLREVHVDSQMPVFGTIFGVPKIYIGKWSILDCNLIMWRIFMDQNKTLISTSSQRSFNCINISRYATFSATAFIGDCKIALQSTKCTQFLHFS